MSYFKHRKRNAFKNPNPCLKQTNYGNGQIVQTGWFGLLTKRRDSEHVVF